jgi:hypothetical protein
MFYCLTKLIYRQPQPFTHAEHVGHRHVTLQLQPQVSSGVQLHPSPHSQLPLLALRQSWHRQCPQLSVTESLKSGVIEHITHLPSLNTLAPMSHAHMAAISSSVDATREGTAAGDACVDALLSASSAARVAFRRLYLVAVFNTVSRRCVSAMFVNDRAQRLRRASVSHSGRDIRSALYGIVNCYRAS